MERVREREIYRSLLKQPPVLVRLFENTLQDAHVRFYRRSLTQASHAHWIEALHSCFPETNPQALDLNMHTLVDGCKWLQLMLGQLAIATLQAKCLSHQPRSWRPSKHISVLSAIFIHFHLPLEFAGHKKCHKTSDTFEIIWINKISCIDARKRMSNKILQQLCSMMTFSTSVSRCLIQTCFMKQSQPQVPFESHVVEHWDGQLPLCIAKCGHPSVASNHVEVCCALGASNTPLACKLSGRSLSWDPSSENQCCPFPSRALAGL